MRKRYSTRSTLYNEIVYQGVKFLHNSDFRDYYDVNPSWLIAYAGKGWEEEGGSERDFIWKCWSSLTFICWEAFISIDEMASSLSRDFVKSNILITVMTSYVYRMIGNWFECDFSIRRARDWNSKWEVTLRESFVMLAGH